MDWKLFGEAVGGMAALVGAVYTLQRITGSAHIPVNKTMMVPFETPDDEIVVVKAISPAAYATERRVSKPAFNDQYMDAFRRGR